jgi:hypothetical protein
MIRLYTEGSVYSLMTVGSMGFAAFTDIVPAKEAVWIAALFAFLCVLLAALGFREGRRIMTTMDSLPPAKWYPDMEEKVDRLLEAFYGGPHSIGVNARLEKGSDRFQAIDGRLLRLEDSRWSKP